MDVSRWFEQNVGPRLLHLHDQVYQKTEGRIGHKFPGVPPALLLHTTGAKTGRPRTNSLTYARDGDAYLVVASNGGSDRNPAWYHNLRANPNIEINVGPKRFAVTARRVTPDDSDYQRMWQIVNKNNFNQYNRYQQRTSRPIPIVELKGSG
jgi:deazaflavin-dependent oxidoreductase (nitroreductase family)